jgi:hypothetical protein
MRPATARTVTESQYIRQVRRRRRISQALVIAASVVLLLALVAGYVRHVVVDSDQFANRATAALRDDAVKTLVAERITDQVVLRNRSDLLAARPIIESVAGSVVSSGAFTGLFRSGIRDVHAALFQRDENTLTLTVADVGTVLAAALQTLRPSLADQVERTGGVALLTRDVPELSARVARAAQTVKVIALLLAVAGIALAAAAIWLSPDRRHTVLTLGIAAATGGVLLVVGLGIARSIAIRRLDEPDAQAAAGAVWDAFLGDLRTVGWLVAACGAVTAAAAASLIRPLRMGEPLRRAGAFIGREPARPALRAVRGGALVLTGVIVIVARDAVLTLVVTLIGVYLVYEGVNAILQLIYRPRTEHEAEAPRRRRRLVGPVLAGGAVLAAVAIFLASGGATTAAPRAGGCEGREELCDRAFDKVALVATHNSMSVPLPGWFSSEQDAPIADQLAAGVRGLLIDTHYADKLPNGNIRTEVGDAHKLRQAVQQDGVSPEAVDAALRLRERAGFAGEGERGMYLCHTFCELGATALEPVLDDLHAFLVANPGEIVVVVNQDYVTPADFVKAVTDAGLADMAYRGPTDHWPTLREMIDSGQRVVFLAENHAGAAPWYRPAYHSIVEETPFTFTSVGQLTDPSKLAATCRPNRGPDNAPLLLINHWISTDPVPLPSHADEVNAYKPLLARVRDCERIRHHVANLVAINFFRRGDVFKVVDTLNGVGEAR